MRAIYIIICNQNGMKNSGWRMRDLIEAFSFFEHQRMHKKVPSNQISIGVELLPEERIDGMVWRKKSDSPEIELIHFNDACDSERLIVELLPRTITLSTLRETFGMEYNNILSQKAY